MITLNVTSSGRTSTEKFYERDVKSSWKHAVEMRKRVPQSLIRMDSNIHGLLLYSQPGQPVTYAD